MISSLFFVVMRSKHTGEEESFEGGDDVVLHGRERAEKSEEDGQAEDEFEALLNKTMAESVEKSKIARATTQVGELCARFDSARHGQQQRVCWLFLAIYRDCKVKRTRLMLLIPRVRRGLLAFRTLFCV